MIWLASYPRSGNTFFRIVLDEVYGICSSSMHDEGDDSPEYADFPVVKTHEPASRVVPADPAISAVCLVRDGRDAMVSAAHFHKDLVDPESDFRVNLENEVRANGGEEHFGGWSHNVASWMARGALILRFEDLIADPIATVERTRGLLQLPEPRPGSLPSFEELRGEARLYGSGSVQVTNDPTIHEKFFRRGHAGAWKDEMPDDVHERFWSIHGGVMSKLGYTDGRPARKSLFACMLWGAGRSRRWPQHHRPAR